MFSFPIFNKQQGVLSSEKLIEWKRLKGVYNFKTLPKTVILTPSNSYIGKHRSFFMRKIKGLSGLNYILNKRFLYSSSFGNGAPAIITHLEELRAFGVENFIFIGYAGILNLELSATESYIINSAFSASGTSFFYHKNEAIKYKTEYSKIIAAKLFLTEKIVISTDAPFRETDEFINHFKYKGADLIDMETASILAFSKYYTVNCACILIASDKIENNVWIPPKKSAQIKRKINATIHQLIANGKS